jgi:membrane associated rhomboid family serine protease
MFVHSGPFHLFGNALSLFFFGPKLEQHLGTRFVGTVYLAAGIFAAFVSVALFPASAVPMVGASGAISGILGLYVTRFPRDQVFVPIGFLPVAVPAWGFLIIFIVLQFFIAFTASNVAWWAHLAGLFVGLGVGGWLWLKKKARGGRGVYRPEAGAGWSVEYHGR